MSPAARPLPGDVDVYAAWRSDGQGVVVAIYDSKADADAAAAKIQALWGSMADLLKGAPNANAYDNVEKIAGWSRYQTLRVRHRGSNAGRGTVSDPAGPQRLGAAAWNADLVCL